MSRQPSLYTKQEISGTSVFLEVKRKDSKLIATISISKAKDEQPIFDDKVAVIIEDTEGSLLEPVGWPDPGILPEVHTRGTTASAEFTFKANRNIKLKRAIVVLRGDWAEFDLTQVHYLLRKAV